MPDLKITDETLKIILSNRLQFAIDAAETTPTALARNVGISDGGMFHMIKGHSLPNAATLRRIADELNVSINWLIPGEQDITPELIQTHIMVKDFFDDARGKKKPASAKDRAKGMTLLTDTERNSDWQAAPTEDVPVVGYIGAGAEVFAIDDHLMGDGLDYVTRQPGMDRSTVAAIVRGNSNSDVMQDGSIVYWSTRRFDVVEFFGEMVVCHLVDGRKLVKILQCGSQPGHYDLYSTNIKPIKDVMVESISPIDWIKMRR